MRKPRVAISALRIALGLVFLTIGVAKLTASLQTVEFFAAIGWGQWFRYLTGSIDILGVLLFFVPRWTFYGALLLASSIGLATVLCLTTLHNDPAIPLTLTLLAATLAWFTRPSVAKIPTAS